MSTSNACFFLCVCLSNEVMSFFLFLFFFPGFLELVQSNSLCFLRFFFSLEFVLLGVSIQFQCDFTVIGDHGKREEEDEWLEGRLKIKRRLASNYSCTNVI